MLDHVYTRSVLTQVNNSPSCKEGEFVHTSIDHCRNVLFMTLRTDMSHVRVTVIIYHAPLWDRKRFCQRARAAFELCGWILEWLTAAL